MSAQPASTFALFTYGLFSGAARVVVPPVIDVPFVRAVRGAMFERVAKGSNVVLSGEARRVLAELETPPSARGVAEQAARWLVGKVVPGAMVFDVARTVLTTYGAGALFARYLEHHREEGAHKNDPVFDAVEADAVRHGLREAMDLFSPEQGRALVRVLEAVVKAGAGDGAQGMALPQRVGEALAVGARELPVQWVAGLEEAFVREVALRRGKRAGDVVSVRVGE